MSNASLTRRHFAVSTNIDPTVETLAPAGDGAVRVSFTAHLAPGYKGYTAILTANKLTIEGPEWERKLHHNGGCYDVYGFVMNDDGSIIIHCEGNFKIHAKVVITPDVILSLLPNGLFGDVSHVDKCWLPWVK